MNSLHVVNYESSKKNAWDEFVAKSKNGVFLFYRDYMEYHADRFPDFSLMFYDERGRLVALLPATVKDGVVSSHAGLTFGGLLTDASMKVGLMLDVFDAMVANLRAERLRQLVYKAIPHIYHRLPAEEDLYALFRHRAHLCRRDVSVTIELPARLPFSKGRKWALKQAQKAGLRVNRSFDFDSFMSIEEQVLGEKYHARPVHTTAELTLLASRFPDNIKLFAAHQGAAMIAGVIIYESEQVAHAQYIGAADEGRTNGALDLIMSYLINDYYSTKAFFDFGVSTEPIPQYLNAGLIENKQSYGARAIAHDFYEIDLHAT
jgi:hypothetical protein